MKRAWASIIVVVLMILSLMASIVISSPEVIEPEAFPVIEDVYFNPQHPIGYEYDVGDGYQYILGWGGDVVTCYAVVTGVEPGWNVYLEYGYCHVSACVNGEPPGNYGPDDDPMGPPWIMPMGGFNMTYEGGDLYSYLMMGDWHSMGISTYTASDFDGIHVYGSIYAKFNATTTVQSPHFDFYPYWPPSSINVSSELSRAPSMAPDTIFWVNGSANYYDRLNWHDQPPTEESNVKITIEPGGTEFLGMTDINGDYSIQVTAPSGLGSYVVNTTVTNSTFNRNVVCVSDEIPIMIIIPTLFNIPIGVSGTGWDFISFPICMNGDVTTILDDSLMGDSGTTWDMVQWYDAQNQEWKSYAAFKPASLNNMPFIDNTMGAWVHITSNVGNLMITTGFEDVYSGFPASIDLLTGWNLVGYPSATQRLASDTLPAEADIVGVYDGGQPYSIIDESVLTGVMMQEGNAYWVHVNADCTWQVDP